MSARISQFAAYFLILTPGLCACAQAQNSPLSRSFR